MSSVQKEKKLTPDWNVFLKEQPDGGSDSCSYLQHGVFHMFTLPHHVHEHVACEFSNENRVWMQNSCQKENRFRYPEGILHKQSTKAEYTNHSNEEWDSILYDTFLMVLWNKLVFSFAQL